MERLWRAGRVNTPVTDTGELTPPARLFWHVPEIIEQAGGCHFDGQRLLFVARQFHNGVIAQVGIEQSVAALKILRVKGVARIQHDVAVIRRQGTGIDHHRHMLRRRIVFAGPGDLLFCPRKRQSLENLGNQAIGRGIAKENKVAIVEVLAFHLHVIFDG